MAQKAIFKMDTLRITQGYGYSVDGVSAYSYSHTTTYALDLGGADGGSDYLYAPFDCIVKRIYGSYNAIWFQSLNPVLCADGKTRTLMMMCLHMNNSDKNALGMYVGKVFKQGQRCYREGVAGNVTGAHIHMEIGEGPMTGTGWHATYVNGKEYWQINNKLIPSKVLFLSPDTKQVKALYKWTVATDAEETPAEPTVDFTALNGKVINVYTNNCEYFNTTDVNHPLGKLKIGSSYPCTAKSTGKVYGYEWVKFLMDGKTYYTALVNDGRVLVEDDESESQTGGTVSKGDKVYINGTVYASSTAKTGTTKRGYYYIYDGVKINGRYRITNAAANVGKTPVGTYVSGYVDATLLGETASGYAAGQRVFVSGTLFTSSKSSGGVYKAGNYYYIYDGQQENGRYRVTNLPSNVGKTPAGRYVSGWVAKSAMRKA